MSELLYICICPFLSSPCRPTPHQQRVPSRHPEENHYAVSNPMPFNIAAAIDPTYHRRAHEFQQDETEAKVPITLASSMPVRGTSLTCCVGAWSCLKSPRSLPNILHCRVTHRVNFTQERYINFSSSDLIL